jgi:magnesium transporter
MPQPQKPSPANHHHPVNHAVKAVGNGLGRTLGATTGAVTKTVAVVGKIGRTVRKLPTPRLRKARPGTAPGIEHADLAAMPSGEQHVYVTCIDYGLDRVQTREVEDIEQFLAEPRPDWASVRWINVDGLADMRVIRGLAQQHALHPLVIEDMLHLNQRPKVESYGNGENEKPQLFVVAHMLHFSDAGLLPEQISLILEGQTLLTFQERRGDIWDPIRQRIDRTGSRLRINDASFLLYALLDAVVDHCFPILEHYSERLEHLEELVLANPDQNVIAQIHGLRHDLLLLRRELWPTREMISALAREDSETLSPSTRLYLRDVYDHAVQVIDLVETYREVAGGLAETYMTAVSNRMNEIMKVLSIVASIFIPISFLAGVFGMNFDYIPGLHKLWGFAAFCLACVGITASMLFYFRRRGWF